MIVGRKDIPSKFLSRQINLRKIKWLMLGTYHPSNQPDDYFFKSIGIALYQYHQTSEKNHCWVILMLKIQNLVFLNVWRNMGQDISWKRKLALKTQKALHKRWSYPLQISSVNVTKSAGNCDLVTFTEEICMENCMFCAV